MQKYFFVKLALLLLPALTVDFSEAFAQKQAIRPSTATQGLPSNSRPAGFVSVPNVEFWMSRGAEKNPSDCPTLVQAIENWDDDENIVTGSAPLAWLAEGFTLVSKDSDRAIWRAPLKKWAKTCRGSSTGSTWLSSESLGKSPLRHIWIWLKDGHLTLLIDLRSLPESGDLLDAELSPNRMPTWKWKLGT